MIKIVDYGLGNITAFVNAYKRANIPLRIAKTAGDLSDATKLIVPGVGAFDHAMELLNASGMRGTLEELVLGKRVPVIGICVGMQILAESSEEGEMPGLGWIEGRVRWFRSESKSAALPVPHMGWNDVTPGAGGAALFRGFETVPRFYFLHSFFFECSKAEHVIGTASYGINFACAVRSGNVYGVQFHPEKSHHWGQTLLKNFAEL